MQGAPPADSLRAVLDSVFADPSYAWLETPAPLVWLRRAWRWLTENLASFQADNPEFFRWFVILLIVLLALIMLHAGWVLLRTARATEDIAAPNGVESAAPQSATWYRAEAERLGTAGHYPEALAAAFHGLVLELDGLGVVRYHPSKTPREYLRDRTLAPEDRPRLAALVQGLYGYRFGHYACGPEEYRAWVDAAAVRWHAAPT